MPATPKINLNEYFLRINQGKIQLHRGTCNQPSPLVAQWWIRNSNVTAADVVFLAEEHHKIHS